MKYWLNRKFRLKKQTSGVDLCTFKHECTAKWNDYIDQKKRGHREKMNLDRSFVTFVSIDFDILDDSAGVFLYF